MATASVEHIDVDEKGSARITGTRIRVAHIAIETRLGLSPAQIRDQYPSLSLAQIHAALSYYYDHQPELDAQIEREYQESEMARLRHSNPVTREELLRRKHNARPAEGR